MPRDVLSLLGMLLVLAAVLGGCYLATRWVGASGRFGPAAGAGRLRVLERTALGREHALLVVQVADRYFLLGSSPSGLTLLAELTGEEGELWSSPPPSDTPASGKAPDFRAMLRQLREKK